MAATNFMLPASRAGVGSVVVTETTTMVLNVSNVGVVKENGTGGGGGGGGGQTVRVMVLA